MNYSMRTAQREAKNRNRIDKEAGHSRRHEAVKTRHWSMDEWCWKPCWTVVMVKR
jgi:hypothetical protein